MFSDIHVKLSCNHYDINKWTHALFDYLISFSCLHTWLKCINSGYRHIILMYSQILQIITDGLKNILDTLIYVSKHSNMVDGRLWIKSSDLFTNYMFCGTSQVSINYVDKQGGRGISQMCMALLSYISLHTVP